MPDATVAVLVVFIAIMVTIGVVVLGVVAVILWKLHMPVKAAAAALSSIAYVILPFDFVPEVPLGPIGLADDLLIVVAGATYVSRTLARRRRRVVSGPGGRALR